MELNLEQNTDTDLSNSPNQREEPDSLLLRWQKQMFCPSQKSAGLALSYTVWPAWLPLLKDFVDQINLCYFSLTCLNNMVIIINSKQAVSRHFSWCFEM